LLEFLLQGKSARLAGAQVYPKRCGDSGDSQRATWLEGLCRAHAPHPAPDNSVEHEIAAAGFSE
jgi:hypothetical protein